MKNTVFVYNIHRNNLFVVVMDPYLKGSPANMRMGLGEDMKDESGENIIGTREGIIKVRTMRRKGSSAERWEQGELDKFTGTPWEPVPGHLPSFGYSRDAHTWYTCA